MTSSELPPGGNPGNPAPGSGIATSGGGADRPCLVLTAVGPDRPGLVSALSAWVREAGANLEDTRMAQLGGEFALIVLLTGSPDALQRVEQLSGRIEGELGLTSSTRRTTPSLRPPGALAYRLRVSGIDRPGIVQRVSGVLAHRGINVASLSSRVANAPLTGTPMFHLEATLQIPGSVALSELRGALGATCDEENLDFFLEAES
jgi:glycine cleavage system transcriptional repressor